MTTGGPEMNLLPALLIVADPETDRRAWMDT